MKLKKLNFVFAIIFLLNVHIINACSVFIANDGKNVWIGNNEDELQNTKYRMWFYPVKNNDFGYTIWTELSFGKLLNGFSYLNPQGGLNQYGLFIDFTAIDDVEVIIDPTKPDRKKQVVTDILKSCKTVEEALAYLSKYNLMKIKSAQLFIADATGNYGTVHGGYVIRKTENNFAVTNYCINNEYNEPCHRRDIATQYLASTKRFQLNDVTSILEKSTQKLPNNLITNYSMAVNLKTSTIYLYYKNDFTTVSTISVTEELKKGKYHKNVEEYFPKNVTCLIENELSGNGIDKAIEKYKELRKNSFDIYNFKNNDVINLAISWIEKGKTNESIKLLECLKEFDAEKIDLYSWLGVAYKKENNDTESNKNFAKAFQVTPNNYVATLFGKQENQKVTFKLQDFEGAEQVSVIGDFTEWTKNPIKMKKENGIWVAEILLPKGEVIYKFIVNKEYLADNKNFMHIGEGPKIYSKLYVW